MKSKDFNLEKYYDLLGNFDLSLFSKHNIDYIQNDMNINDYLEHKEKLSSKIHNLYLKDYESLNIILQIASTMNLFLSYITQKIASDSFWTDRHQKHLERNLVHDADSIVFETDNQLTDTLYKFMDIFEKKFVMLGVIYQYKRNILDHIEIDEVYFIKEYDELDFSQIEAFFKLYQEGELD